MVTEAQEREIASKLVSGVYSAFEPNNLAPETVLFTTTLCCLGNNVAPIGQELAEWTVSILREHGQIPWKTSCTQQQPARGI